ncbi:MAG TPA: aromatic-ring-hydroxylating dioxygenase subunit beta [Alphaproteobacteria bacterium]|nr:aromatic-ring-hydroxylating dioxygenase subunit beta [Alphaproteobacteria bacterium]
MTSALTQSGAPSAPALAPADELLLVRELERFVIHELELLDTRDFEAWNALFAPDGVYWAPSRVDQVDPIGELSLFYDDREIRDMRFARLRHPRAHSQIPFTRTSHLVGNFVIDSVDAKTGSYAFHCRFVTYDFRPELPQREFAGRYDYRLVRDGGTFKIKFKKAVAINCDATHLPISVPI